MKLQNKQCRVSMVKCVCYRWWRWRHFKVIKSSMKNLFFFNTVLILLCWKDFLSEKKPKSKPVTWHVAIGRCRNAPVGCSALEEPAHSRMIASLNRTRIGSPFSPQHRYWIFFFPFRHSLSSIVIIVSAAYLARTVNALSRTHTLNSSFSSLYKAKSTFKTVSSASLTEFELTRE